MYSPETRRAAVAKVAQSSIAEVADELGVSPSSLRRWVSRTDLNDRPRSGRPQIQTTAGQVLEALVGTAGARISGKDYSTRALAEATGLSQSIVSRAVREMTVPLPDLLTHGAHGTRKDEITLVAGGFPLIVIGVRRLNPHVGGGGPSYSGEAAGDVVPARRIQRRIAGIVAALRSAGVQHWAKRFGSDHRQTDPATMTTFLVSDGQAGTDEVGERFIVFDPLGETRGLSLKSNVETQADFEDFILAVKSVLAGCRDIPGSVLDMISLRVRRGFEGVLWQMSRHVEGQISSTSSDSMEISSWLPRETRSITEHLAITLREEIIDSGYQPGDRINPRLLSRRMEVPRSSVDAALRRMVDDGLLDGSRGGARIPLITMVDVLDLYAARVALGEVLLRALALRPKRYFVPVQLALRQVEASAATKSGIDVENADLHFQHELARASGLRQSARAFEALTLRLRLFISILQLDYSPASDRILMDNRAMLAALSQTDAQSAIIAWRGKVDNAVRHMAGLLSRRRFDQDLWAQLTRRSD